MLEPSEQRRFHRMAIDSRAQYRVEGNAGFVGATIKNLSTGGMLMWLDRALPADAVAHVVLEPVTRITPPLHAQIRVPRCHPVPESEGVYAVACEIEKIAATT